MEGTDERTVGDSPVPRSRDLPQAGTTARTDERPPTVTRRRLITLGALGVAAGGAYAVSQAGGLAALADLTELPGASQLAAPPPPELRIDPRPVDSSDLQAR